VINSSIRSRPVGLRRDAPAAARSSRGRPRLTLGERLRDLILVLMLFCLGGATLTAYTTFRIWQVGQQDGRRHADAIIVLGAAQYNGHPSGALQARLDHAIELYKAGYAPYLITTGGNLPGDRTTEADTGRCYAVRQGGLPASHVLMENTGRTTLESIQHVKALFTAYGFHTALFVSDRSHMLRILRQAQDEGLEAWASPTTTSPDDLDPDLSTKSLLHEVGGFVVYSLVNHDPDTIVQSEPSAEPSGPGASTAPVKC
jgi:uncharacterized SAM-binding protein YcdF (DUF218 family)